MPMVHSAQPLHQSCTEINTISKQTKTRFLLTHVTLGVPSGVPKMISMPIVHSAPTVHLSCTEITTISKWTKTRFNLTMSPRSTIGCAQNDFQARCTFSANHAPILRLDSHYLQTNRNELLTHVTYVYHWVHLKWYPCSWYIWHKLFTNLALGLTLSPNGPK
jgi:hypothetical protein